MSCADCPFADTSFQSITPRKTIEIQKRMVLTVELEFTSPSLLSRARKIFCWPGTEPPSPVPRNYLAPQNTPQTLDAAIYRMPQIENFRDAAAYRQLLRCAAEA